MSGSGGIGQLLKGLIMGIVLILAIIGSMSMLDKNKATDNAATSSPTNSTLTSPATSPEIKAPEINVATQTSTKDINPQSTPPTEKPILEGEKNQIEAIKKPVEAIKYGILKISTINPETKESVLANYMIFNSKNTKIAESNNTSSSSYRLPVGRYRVSTTLITANNTSSRATSPVQSSKNITISAHKLTDEIFELKPPTTIGVLQVSAIYAKNNRPIKANFIIQKENGEIIASRQDVTNSLFKLKAGSYKVTVKNGNNQNFRTIVVEPGESSTEVFKLQEAFLQGKVLVRVFDINSNKPVPADIAIAASNGKIIQALKAVSQTEISLPAGDYKIKVSGPRGESIKKITIIAGQASNQIFRIDTPLTNNPADSVQINDNVSITGVGNNNSATGSTQENTQAESILRLLARNEIDQKPLKSNFYVQTPNGKNIAKKIYSDSAEFNLKPGKYKITVRSKNRKNITRFIQVSPKQMITEVFSLQSNLPTAASTTKPPVANTPTTIPNGFLNVVMQPARKTHFLISDRKGKKIVELTSVPSGNFKLDTGIYVVTAILNGQRRNQTIQVYKDKTTRLSFNANDFQKKAGTKPTIKEGGLRSRIVDSNGRPLRGNLTVTNLQGQVVATANNVTFGEFTLPAVPHIVSVNYQGLSGSEQINITAGKMTVQTFTVSPNGNDTKPIPAQQPRDAKTILREKLKEELRRIF